MAGHGLALVSRRRFCAAPSAVSRQAWRRWNHGADFSVLRFRRSYARGTRLHGNQFHPGGSRDPRYPQHVAIIMDGNGRWATRRLLPARRDTPGRAGRPARGRGLRARRRALPDAVRVQLRELAASRRRGLPADAAVRPGAGARGRQARRAGRAAARDRRSLGLRAAAAGTHFAAQQRTAHNDRLHLTVAANYGGRWDILQATRAMLAAEPDLAAHRNGSMRRICRATCRCPGRPSRTCSSAPAENNAFQFPDLADGLRGVLLHGSLLAGFRRRRIAGGVRLVSDPRAPLRPHQRPSQRRRPK